jgi:hypothetical protein
VESDQRPFRSHRLLQLPPNFESLPSKRRRIIRRGTHSSTVHTCDSTRMSIEPSLQNTGSPSTPATTMVVVPEAPIITMARPIVNAQYIASNPFGFVGHSPSYNIQSIPMASSPFSYGMSNFTS